MSKNNITEYGVYWNFMEDIYPRLLTHFGIQNNSFIELVEIFIDSLFSPFCLNSLYQDDICETDKFNSKLLKIKVNQKDCKKQTHTYKIAEEFLTKCMIDIEADISSLDVNKDDKLAHLMFILGHVASNLSKFADQIINIMKQKTESRKNEIISTLNKSKRPYVLSSKTNHNDSIDEEIERNLMDCDEDQLETDIDDLTIILNSIFNQNGSISKYFPIIYEIVDMVSEKYILSEQETDIPLMPLENMCLITFCKLMVVNKTFCENNIAKLFSLLSLENFDPHNLLICIKELFIKYPLILDDYEKQFYSILGHKSAKVRQDALRVIAHLALTDIIRVKLCFPYVCELLLDESGEIQAIALLFLEKLHLKSSSNDNTAIYNLIPTIIHLKDFQKIFDILIKFITKERQINSLINKQSSLLAQAYSYSSLNFKYGISKSSINPNIKENIKENMQYILKVLCKTNSIRPEQA